MDFFVLFHAVLFSYGLWIIELQRLDHKFVTGCCLYLLSIYFLGKKRNLMSLCLLIKVQLHIRDIVQCIFLQMSGFYTDSKSTHNKLLNIFESMIYLLVVSVMARSETFSLMIAILFFIHFGDAY